jgi:hypothetical protein
MKRFTRRVLPCLALTATTAACFSPGSAATEDTEGGTTSDAGETGSPMPTTAPESGSTHDTNADADSTTTDATDTDPTAAETTSGTGADESGESTDTGEPAAPCILDDDFSAYPDGDELEGVGSSGEGDCDWVSPWVGPYDQDIYDPWTVDEIDVIDGFTGIHARANYGTWGHRTFNVPEASSALYASVRFADLCRLTQPGENLWDGAGDCRSYGKLLQLRLCTDIEGTCISALIDTVIDASGVPGEFRLEYGEDAVSFGSIPRPMADDYPEGVYITLGIAPDRIAVWLDHSLEDGVPAGVPDAQLDDPDLGGNGPGDFRELSLGKGAGWAEGGGAAAELFVLAEPPR